MGPIAQRPSMCRRLHVTSCLFTESAADQAGCGGTGGGLLAAVAVDADQAVTAMATGRSHNLHEMMLALDRADVSFRLMTKVRNKAVEAYQEIMRLQF